MKRELFDRCAAAAFVIVACLLAGRVALAADTDEPVMSGDALAHASGEAIYRRVCQGCHMPDARGAHGAGAYPALAGNPRLISARYTASVVFYGRSDMPHFGAQPDLSGFEALVTMHLDDDGIAAVVNYVRSHFGNHYDDKLTAEDVAALHR